METQVKSRGAGKRLTEDRKAAESGAMTEDQFEFIMAVEDYKKQRRQTYVSATQSLEIALFLGYRKVAEKGAYRLDRDKENNVLSGTKQCNLCKKVLPLSEFKPSERSKDGTQGSCKACNFVKNKVKFTKRQRLSKRFQKGEPDGESTQQSRDQEIHICQTGFDASSPGVQADIQTNS